jgi:hypothetical protein
MHMAVRVIPPTGKLALPAVDAHPHWFMVFKLGNGPSFLRAVLTEKFPCIQSSPITLLCVCCLSLFCPPLSQKLTTSSAVMASYNQIELKAT